MIAAFFALVASLLFGLTSHIQKSALRGTDVAVGAFLSVGTMTVLCWIAAPFLIDWAWFETRAALIFAACGLIFPAASQRLQVASIVQVGPALTSAMGSFAPLFAVSLAIVCLGETLNLQGALGMALMLAGLLISAFGPGRGLPRGFPLVALALPLGASLARGIVQPATKHGFGDVDSAFFATLVMSTVATFVLGLWLLLDRRRGPLKSDRQGRALFILNGFVIGGGILTLHLAISYGSVSIAAPLASTTPLWTLLLGVLYFHNEVLTRRHLVMATLVVVGAILVVMR